MGEIYTLWLYYSIYFPLVGGFKHGFFSHNIWDYPSHWLIFFQEGSNHQPDQSEKKNLGGGHTTTLSCLSPKGMLMNSVSHNHSLEGEFAMGSEPETANISHRWQKVALSRALMRENADLPGPRWKITCVEVANEPWRISCFFQYQLDYRFGIVSVWNWWPHPFSGYQKSWELVVSPTINELKAVTSLELS